MIVLIFIMLMIFAPVMTNLTLVLTVIPLVLVDLALVIVDSLLVGLPVGGVRPFILPQLLLVRPVGLYLLVVLLNLLADLRPGRSAEYGKGE